MKPYDESSLYDDIYKQTTFTMILSDIDDLGKWSIYHGDKELDKIQQIKKLIEELKETL